MTTETGGLVIDEGRLARAVHLDATRVGSGHRCYQVTGGARSHVVDLDDDGCDCADYAFRHQLCKHVIRALLAEGDGEVIAALRELVPAAPTAHRGHPGATNAGHHER